MEERAKTTASCETARRVVVHTPEPAAGAGQYVAELANALAARGERVALLCPANFAYENEAHAGGVQIIKAPAREISEASLWRRLVRNIAFVLRSLKAFCATVKRGDIVHFQFALQLGLALLFFFAARFRCGRVVLTVHDPLPHRWILPRPFRWVEAALLSVGYSLCDQLIVHNQVGRKLLIERFAVESDRISVIPHGPLRLTAGRQWKASESLKDLRLLAFGSLRENKGLHLSIAAMQRLRRMAQGRAVSLTIAGSTANAREQKYWEKLQQQIQAHPDGIRVIERRIPEEEIGDLFSEHDAILLPYVDFSSDSGVAMLAFSQQRPIIATRAGGLGELLAKSDGGVVIEAPTVEAVIDAIETARRAPQGWLEQKGLNGYNYAVSERSWDSIAHCTQVLYDSLLPRTNGSGTLREVCHEP